MEGNQKPDSVPCRGQDWFLGSADQVDTQGREPGVSCRSDDERRLGESSGPFLRERFDDWL